MKWISKRSAAQPYGFSVGFGRWTDGHERNRQMTVDISFHLPEGLMASQDTRTHQLTGFEYVYKKFRNSELYVGQNKATAAVAAPEI
jgi:hypothetical protein